MPETRHSLCVTYPNRNFPDKYLFFRIADYDVNEHSFTPASYSLINEEDNIYEPKIIGARPKEAAANMTVIREWNFMEDDVRKTVSINYVGTIYEVIFPKELKGVDINETSKIREILYNGITINENSGNDLLIVIGSSPSQYTTLYCHKNNFSFTGSVYKIHLNISDTLHSIHYMEEYEINKTDIIDTEKSEISFADGRNAPTRYFYRFTELPSLKCNFQLYELRSYIPYYISKHLKKKKSVLQLSDNDIRKVAACIEEILCDNDQIQEYFSLTGYDKNELNEILPQYTDDICKTLLGDSDVDRIISKCVLNSDEVMQKCIETIRMQWLAEKNAEKEAIILEIEEIRRASLMESHKCDNIIASADKADKHRVQIENEILQLQNEIHAAEEKLVQVNLEIENELKNFSENIVHNVGLCSAVQSISGTIKNSSPIHSYINTQKCVKSHETRITDKDDLEDALAEHLSSCGFEAKAYEIAQLITHCVFNGVPLIVSGKGLIIANCLSVLFNGMGTSIVNIPVGYTDLADITNKIQNTPSSVVYVTGVFDSFSENVFHTIKNSCENKILFLSVDGIDIGMLSPAVWSGAYFLDSDMAFDYCENEKLISATIEELSFNSSYNAIDIKDKKKLLKPFIETGILCGIAAIQYSKIMVDIQSQVKSDWLILLQLCVNAKAVHKTEELSSIFEELGVDEKNKAFLAKYM